VEAPFYRIEAGFLPGCEFNDWRHLNRRARETCDTWNAKFSNKLHASRRELFAAERPYLKPLPPHVPEVYRLHSRIVDSAGYLNVNRVRYSAPYKLIGRMLEVRETLERIEIYDGPRRVAEHARAYGSREDTVTDPSHRPPRGEGLRRHPAPAPEETEILQLEPRVTSYVLALKKLVGGRRAPLRRFLSMLQEYPREPFLSALAEAERYGLFDLERLEKIILRRIAEEYFVLSLTPSPGDDHE
jgi:hypothetical protein